jgi:prolycopene isomerase
VSTARDPSRDTYDVVVVGAGLGGISAAAILARTGRSVLCVDRQDGAGGFAHAFTRGSYTFDPAVHVTVEAGPGLMVNNLLEWLGAGDICEWVPSPHVYRTVFPGFDLAPPIGLEPFIGAHEEALPEDAGGVRAFFELQENFFRDGLNMAMSMGLGEIEAAVERFPTFFRYRNATVGDVLDDTVTDPRARAVCSSMWPYLALPPSRLSMLALSPFLGVLMNHAPWYPKGSFQRFADAFVAGLERNGGEFLPSTAVESISVEDGRVTGVVLEGDRRVSAGAVISNADANHTFRELIGIEHVRPGYAKRLERYELSLSAVVVYAATTLDLTAAGAGLDNFLFVDWDHEQSYAGVLAGNPGGMWGSVPTLADPSLAPDGEHIVILTSLAPYDLGEPWEGKKQGWGEQMVKHFDEHAFPGLADSLTHFEVAAPPEMRAYTGNTEGAIYAWATTAKQMGSKRLPHKGPLDGLWLSGAWSEEGPGSFRTILSGLNTARMILGPEGMGELPLFRSEDLPQDVLGGSRPGG